MISPERARTRAAARRELRSLQAAATVQPRAGWPHWALVVTSIVTLLVATSSAVMTWNTTQYGASVGLQKESRDKRSQLYASYLGAARAWAATADAEAALTQQAIYAEKVSTAKSKRPTSPAAQTAYDLAQAVYRDLDERRRAASKDHEAAWAEFYKQADQLFVYGSEDSWRTHLAIATIFVRHEEGVTSDEELAQQPKVSSDSQFQAETTKFQVIFCREVSPLPRAGCK